MQNDRSNLISELKNYTPSPEEDKFIPQFLELLKSDRCFYRDHFNPGHITGSALLLDQSGTKILMNFHRGLNRWLCFGGHADGDEDILAVAIRETMEESGLTAFKPVSTDIFDIDIHPIPTNEKRDEPAHFHFDIRYIMQMTGAQDFILSDESIELKWMDFNTALSMIETNDSLNRMIEKLK